MSFSLHPATPSDIPALVNITSNSKEADNHTQLKQQYGAYDHQATMTQALSDWFTRPEERCRIIKAVDDTSNEVIGWVGWGFRGFDKTGENTTTPARNEPSKSIFNRPAANDTSSTSDQTNTATEVQDLGIARLEQLTSSDLRDWMNRLMPEGTKCMFVHSIVVSPPHRSRGVGSALLEYGTQRADEAGVFIWVHSSEEGVAAFSKAGFEEIGSLKVDLDEFAREEKRKRSEAGRGQDASVPSREYGTYTFRYMKRLPVTLG